MADSQCLDRTSPDYAPLFFERLKEVTRNAPFWDPAG